MFFWNSLAFLWSNGCWQFDLWGSVTPQETEPALPVSVQSLWWRCGLTAAFCGLRALSTAVVGGSVCRPKSSGSRSPLLPLPPPKSGLRSNYREGTQPHPSAENWIKDLLSMPLPTRARPSFPCSQSLPSGRVHKPLIFIHQRADRMKTTITGN